MTIVCTVSDFKYLYKGLALYTSLQNRCRRRFLLHWLCLDDEVYDTLKARDLPGVLLYNVKELATIDKSFQHAGTLPKSNYGDDYANFCWRSVPCFIEYILFHKVYPSEKLTLIYADSDIFFYEPPELILDIMGEKSVGIHTHRFGGPYDDEKDNGWYNVGVMVFRNNTVGRAVAGTWKTWVLTPGCSLYPKYGTCGDQKWLNLFIPTFGADHICVFDEQGDCFHLAPWNCSGVHHAGIGRVIDKSREQPVVFFHFSHFRMEGEQWFDSLHGEWNPAKDPNIYPYYDSYARLIKSLNPNTI